MSKSIDIALRAAEQQHEKELTAKFSARMQASVRDLGAVDSARHTILSHIATENYQRAIDELTAYYNSKVDFPQFEQRAQRYFTYAIDLINAIKAKRSFPGLQHLAMSKQQELFDKAMEHFEDLKLTVRKIEQIDRDTKLEDIRSTVWVVKAIIYCVFGLLVLAFLMELSRGILPAAWTVIDSTFGDVTNAIFDKLGV